MYSSSVPSYALYLSNPYSSHSSLIGSYSRPSFSKPLPRFHRGFAPHLATISETPITVLRRKYSPRIYNRSKYKAPRPIQINTADIDVSADKYRPHRRLDVTVSPEKRISKSPSPSRIEENKDYDIQKPIQRGRATVRLHTFHADSNKDKKWRQNFNSRELNIQTKKSEEEQEEKIPRNPSFHDICRAISQNSINEALNPGQPDEITRKQSRSFSSDDIFKQIRRNSAEILKENADALEQLLNQEDMNNNLPINNPSKIDQSQKKSKKKEDGFESRGSVKRKKKIIKKKSGEIRTIEDDNNSSLQRKNAVKKIKKTSTDLSFPSDVSGDLRAEHLDIIKDISNVEVEEIKIKPKPVFTATVDIEETKPNLKLIVDNVMVEESPKPKPQKKFKFNVTVQVEEKKPKLIKSKIEDRGKIVIPKSEDALITSFRKNKQRGSLGDICESTDYLPEKLKKGKYLENEEIKAKEEISAVNDFVQQTINNGNKIESNVKQLKKMQSELETKLTSEDFNTGTGFRASTNEESNRTIKCKSCSDLKPKEITKSIIKNNQDKPQAYKKSVSIEETPLTKSKSQGEIILKESSGKPKLCLKEIEPQETQINANVTEHKQVVEFNEFIPGLQSKEGNASMDFWDLIGPRSSTYTAAAKPLKLILSSQDDFNKNQEDYQLEKKYSTFSDEVVANEELNIKDKVESIENKEEIGENVEESDGGAPKKLVSKRSLINKATNDDPDLHVFVPPPKPPTPEPQPDVFVPLQSNRLSQWMHPFKKPEQLDVCPVEIYATPKAIRKRHYPGPRNPPPPAESTDSDSEESEEDTEDSEEETSDDEGIVGKSTSSNDSGFNSSNGCAQNRKNKDCDVNIHKKCEKLTANLCGINQKLIVEAIESVKKGSSDTRDSPTSNPAHNPAFSLDSCDTVEEFQMSSTYVGFQKSGRITPPATTIPRFRKYAIDDFNFLKVLGKGSFGKVLLAELKDTEYYYAIKCLKKDVVLEDDDVECTLIERKVLALGTKHPYLCHLLCTFQTESHLFFVMEFLNGGDLMFHIQQSGRFPESTAKFYGAEIASGLKFLHSKGIVYRDLKLDNIVLDFDGHVRIADFGMCKLQIFLDRMADTFCGTPDYMAPEIIKGLHYNQCVDWWSFGVLLYEMLIGQSPFSGCDEDELFWSICNEKPVFPRFLSAEANSVLTQLLEKDATKRLGFKQSPHGEIQGHIFFRPIAWDLLERRQLEAPFKPNLQHPLDTQYFDKTFTVEKAKLTPIEKNILQSIDQSQFQGFSYTNPNATDR